MTVGLVALVERRRLVADVVLDRLSDIGVLEVEHPQYAVAGR